MVKMWLSSRIPQPQSTSCELSRGCWGWRSGPHSCAAGALPTELHPHPKPLDGISNESGAPCLGCGDHRLKGHFHQVLWGCTLLIRFAATDVLKFKFEVGLQKNGFCIYKTMGFIVAFSYPCVTILCWNSRLSARAPLLSGFPPFPPPVVTPSHVFKSPHSLFSLMFTSTEKCLSGFSTMKLLMFPFHAPFMGR